ncbi:MAG: hypothetical protein IAF94_07290 [Pirellulaceae bacterium]|nr:hypothetical protein [Pirellulaceae bacterium]
MGEENRGSSGGGTVMIVVAILGGLLLLGCCGGLVVLGLGSSLFLARPAPQDLAPVAMPTGVPRALDEMNQEMKGLPGPPEEMAEPAGRELLEIDPGVPAPESEKRPPPQVELETKE